MHKYLRVVRRGIFYLHVHANLVKTKVKDSISSVFIFGAILTKALMSRVSPSQRSPANNNIMITDSNIVQTNISSQSLKKT